MRVVPDKDDSDRVHISITLSQASSQQAGSKKVKRVADEDLAATWLLFYPWAKYTGKRTHASHRYTTCSCCLENNPDVSKYGKGEGAVVADKSDLTTHDASKSHLTVMERKAAKAGAPGGIRNGIERVSVFVAGINKQMVLS